MTVSFSDNFDSEAEGTSPPANWNKSTSYAPDYCEVDDGQYNSSPHSMYLHDTGGHGACSHPEATGWTTERVTMYLYFPNTSQKRRIYIGDTTSTSFTFGDMQVLLDFEADGDISYYDGSTNDTGYNYTASAWHKLELELDHANDTFDAWYNDTQIVTDGGFANSGTEASSKKIELWAIYVAGTNNYWIDDVSIGTASSGWTGKVSGVTNPAKVASVEAANIESVSGVT